MPQVFAIEYIKNVKRPEKLVAFGILPVRTPNRQDACSPNVLRAETYVRLSLVHQQYGGIYETSERLSRRCATIFPSFKFRVSLTHFPNTLALHRLGVALSEASSNFSTSLSPVAIAERSAVILTAQSRGGSATLCPGSADVPVGNQE